MSPLDLIYDILGLRVVVRCPVPELRHLVQSHWGPMATTKGTCDVTYSISREHPSSEIILTRVGQAGKSTSDEGQFLYELESDVCIALQQIRRDLWFLHAAVAEWEGEARLLVAESGGGKSTTLWGMLHHGWRYMSDELAPIDPANMQVYAYPRSLSLKGHPPETYPLPNGRLETPRTIHIPVGKLPLISDRAHCPLAAIYFLKYCPHADTPQVRPVSIGEASARLYANSLNQLAHDNAGLDAAVRIASSVPCFGLDSAELASTCQMLHSCLQ